MGKEKDNIYFDVEGTIKSLIIEERKKLQIKFGVNKNEIDNKFMIVEKEFTYGKEENEQNNYLDEIHKIKYYSDKILNFENLIKTFR